MVFILMNKYKYTIMNILNKISRLLALSLILVGVSSSVTSCKDEAEVLQSGNGYVQFKVYKSASYEKTLSTRSGDNQLDYLNDAKKIKVMLRNTDFSFSQTLPLSAYNDETAEYGLRSEKLSLTPGEYTVVGYYLYGKTEDQLYVGQPAEPTTFTVTAGGLVVQDILVDAVARGFVNFTLVKNILKTKGVSDSEPYPFSSINKIDLKIRNTDTKTVQEVKGIKAEYVEDFNGSGTGYRTSYSTTDSLVMFEAGNYEILSYTAYDKTTTLQYYNDEVLKETKFVVEDNKQTDVDVPITLLETSANIKDYIALKNIWEAMDGPNWSYVGESYPAGANWSFDDKDIDMWGNQPGVVLNNNGRVTSLSIGDFGAKGVVPAAIGELSELETLALGTHNDLLRGETIDPLTSLKGELDESHLNAIRSDYMNRFVDHDLKSKLSKEMQLALEIKGIYKPSIQKKAVAPRDIVWGDLTNGITGIHPAIGKLKKLSVLYVANAPIEELPVATPGNETEEPGMAGLTACTDLEIYNCPKMTAFPMIIAEMPELIQVNMAMNKQLSSDEFKKGLEAIANGPSKEKIQILYLGYNNMEELPSNMCNLKKLGKIDCVNNKLKKLPAFGKDVNLVQASFDYNEIAEIETVDNGKGKQIFCGMEDVESFTFSHNKLEKLPDIFDVNSIYTMASVDFSYNQIDNAGLVGFSGINTSELSLAGNQLTSFPKELFNTGSPLTILNLSANQIDTFEKGDLDGKNTYLLTTLDLTYNRLKELPSDFNGRTLPYLYGLDLSGNQLTGFPWGAVNVSYLTVLSLRNQRDNDGNRVYSEWPTNIAQHIGLRGLFLGGNNIGKVPETETISYLIYILDVSDNPNLILNVSAVCSYIKAGVYNLIYDTTQDIRGCDALVLE